MRPGPPWGQTLGSLYCYPHFDSPIIFGAILDDKKGAVPIFATLMACGQAVLFAFPNVL